MKISSMKCFWLLLLVLLSACGAPQSAAAAAAPVYQSDIITRGPWVDVRAYGAKGDGTTNDTSAFAAALATGKPVYVPKPATAYLLRNLVPPNGAIIYSDAKATITTDTTFGSIQITGGKHDITIDGLRFTSSSYSVVDRTGVELAGATGNYNITVRNCQFDNISNGIRVNGSPNNPSYNCLFERNEMWDVGVGVSLLGLVDSDITFNRIQYRTYLYRGILATHAARCNISDNTIAGNTGVTVTGIIFLYNNPVVTGFQQSNDNIIARNKVRNIMEEGISLDYYATSHKWEGTATSGSTTSVVQTGAGWTTNAYNGYYAVIVSGTGAGEYRSIISNTSDTLSVSNYFNIAPDGTSKFIIAAPFLRNKIVNNEVNSTGREGISIWGTAFGNVISGNSTALAGGAATSTSSIRVQGYNYSSSPDTGAAFHNSVVNNTIENSGYIGILVSNYSDTTPGFAALGNLVEGNIISGHGVGIKLDYASNGQVRNNTIVNASIGISITANLTTDNSVVGNKPIAVGTPYSISQVQGQVEVEGTAMPTTGTYSKGAFVRNLAPALTGSGGYVTANQKYTIKGWTKLNTGSTNVLNTDWIEERVLTGQ